MTFAITNDIAPNDSRVLLEAARLVHERRYRTGCEALSALLPKTEAGNIYWRQLKSAWLAPMLPLDGFETGWGWWRSRKARVIGACLAAAMAEAEGY